MDKLDKLLLYIQKTNPEMSKDKLIEELSKSRYSAMALFVIYENDRKSACSY